VGSFACFSSQQMREGAEAKALLVGGIRFFGKQGMVSWCVWWNQVTTGEHTASNLLRRKQSIRLTAMSFIPLHCNLEAQILKLCHAVDSMLGSPNRSQPGAGLPPAGIVQGNLHPSFPFPLP